MVTYLTIDEVKNIIQEGENDSREFKKIIKYIYFKEWQGINDREKKDNFLNTHLCEAFSIDLTLSDGAKENNIRKEPGKKQLAVLITALGNIAFRDQVESILWIGIPDPKKENIKDTDYGFPKDSGHYNYLSDYNTLYSGILQDYFKEGECWIPEINLELCKIKDTDRYIFKLIIKDRNDNREPYYYSDKGKDFYAYREGSGTIQNYGKEYIKRVSDKCHFKTFFANDILGFIISYDKSLENDCYNTKIFSTSDYNYINLFYYFFRFPDRIFYKCSNIIYSNTKHVFYILKKIHSLLAWKTDYDNVQLDRCIEKIDEHLSEINEYSDSLYSPIALLDCSIVVRRIYAIFIVLGEFFEAILGKGRALEIFKEQLDKNNILHAFGNFNDLQSYDCRKFEVGMFFQNINYEHEFEEIKKCTKNINTEFDLRQQIQYKGWTLFIELNLLPMLEKSMMLIDAFNIVSNDKSKYCPNQSLLDSKICIHIMFLKEYSIFKRFDCFVQDPHNPVFLDGGFILKYNFVHFLLNSASWHLCLKAYMYNDDIIQRLQYIYIKRYEDFIQQHRETVS